MQKRIALIYLGRRGGGARLLRDLSHAWNSQDTFVTSFVREECEFIYDLQGKISAFHLPKRNLKLLLPWLRITQINKIVREVSRGDFDYAVFVMSHPWTPVMLKKLRQLGIETVAVIHDDRAHKGEKWPTRRHLQKEVRFTDHPIFLSSFVSQSYPEIHNPLVFSLDALPLIPQSKKMERILIPGRIRKYKGFENVFRYLSTLPDDVEILIAGQGRFKVPKLITRKFRLINEWIPAKDFERLIMESSHVLLPYIEATQSGIISIAKLYDCHILVTNVGGLREQLQGYATWTILPEDPREFLKSLPAIESAELESSPYLPSIFDLINQLSKI